MEVVVFIAMLSSVGGLIGVELVRRWRGGAQRTRRVLRQTRVVPIAELIDGQLACIVGVAQPDGELLESPIKQQRCIAYDTTIQVFRDDTMRHIVRVDVLRRMIPFFVTDGTGRVRVDAAQAALCNRPVGRNARYEERIIGAGARVRLVGSVTLEPTIGTAAAGEQGFREGALKATLTGTAKYPLLVDIEDE